MHVYTGPDPYHLLRVYKYREQTGTQRFQFHLRGASDLHTTLSRGANTFAESATAKAKEREKEHIQSRTSRGLLGHG